MNNQRAIHEEIDSSATDVNLSDVSADGASDIKYEDSFCLKVKKGFDEKPEVNLDLALVVEQGAVMAHGQSSNSTFEDSSRTMRK